MGEAEITFGRLLRVLLCSGMVIIVGSMVVSDLVSRGLNALMSPITVVELAVLVMSVFAVVVSVASDKSE
ncbi:MAG: hypothetical protein QXM12_00655 [Nitrososphaerota archaeon]